MVESDEEQLEALKKWWNKNGSSLIVIAIIAVGGSFGYRAWENSARETGEAASAIYEDLTVATAAITPGGDDEAMRQTAISLGETLKTEYEDSAYAVLATLHLAKMAVDAGDLDRAQAELEWAISQGGEPHLETIARIRLARLLVAKEDALAALASLQDHEPAMGQIPSYEEARGDAYVALGDMRLARASYQKALDNMNDNATRPLLEIKLADLPLEVVEVIEDIEIVTEEPSPEDEP